MICWGPEAYVGVRDETPVNWGLKGCGADKHDEGRTWWKNDAIVEEAIIESPPLSKLK